MFVPGSNTMTQTVLLIQLNREVRSKDHNCFPVKLGRAKHSPNMDALSSAPDPPKSCRPEKEKQSKKSMQKVTSKKNHSAFPHQS
jgi:hypothetical protein